MGQEASDNFVDFCSRLGEKEIRVDAADIGRYAWAKSGHYEFAEAGMAQAWQRRLSNWLEESNISGIDASQITQLDTSYQFATLQTPNGQQIGKDFIFYN